MRRGERGQWLRRCCKSSKRCDKARHASLCGQIADAGVHASYTVLQGYGPLHSGLAVTRSHAASQGLHDTWCRVGKSTITRAAVCRQVTDQARSQVVVSACQLTPTLAKTMVYQLDDFVPVDNIYSGSQIGKLACFNQLMARFGTPSTSIGADSGGVQYIAVGDGLEEEEISEEVRAVTYAF